MPQIGWFEILIIVAISIIVIGPKDFPFMLKKLAHGQVLLKDMLMKFKKKLLQSIQKIMKIQKINKNKKKKIT